MPQTPNGENLDEIGDWSVEKLDILKAYSEQYALILQKQTTAHGGPQFHCGYIDGFAGAVAGSPAIALSLPTKFDE
jgi:hypothetical protein